MAGDCLFMAGEFFQNFPTQPESASCPQPLIKPLPLYAVLMQSIVQNNIMVHQQYKKAVIIFIT